MVGVQPEYKKMIFTTLGLCIFSGYLIWVIFKLKEQVDEISMSRRKDKISIKRLKETIQSLED
jgi:hypothetical protein